ncbi:MAG TPA: dihydrolipoamide acetyltransferase family protein [Phycisphaerales bacterium]|nr:dihydrolipoamide acetyltransferase family protein [Phycisphaerales bacterium]HMP37161.1 dihydrolipoamide acetyltransferase family protein [Phycisphaerales bacterium]
MPIELTMPRLSDTMESGTIIKWNVKEGDSVSSGTAVADVETDKATMEMQSFDDGVVAKILVPEGKLVPVGTVIALIAEEGEDPASVEAARKRGGGDGAGGGAGGSDAKRDAAEPRRSADAPRSGTGAASGDRAVKQDAAGGPAARERDEQSTQGAPSERSEPRSGREAAAGGSGGGERDARAEADADAGGHADADRGKLRVSPVARRIADEHGVDVRRVSGSGPGGRVVKEDVLAAIERGSGGSGGSADASRSAADDAPARRGASGSSSAPAGPAPAGPGAARPARLTATTIALSGMRQTIARRLVESKTTIPHYQVTMRIAMDALLDLRGTLNRQLAGQGIKLSVNDFLVRACGLAMHGHPEFNASWAGGEGVRVHGSVNIGIAISLPRERGGGLVVGVIRDADAKGLRQISEESRTLAERARGRGLSAEEMSDSTFTISNLGMFGVDHFTAIINPPNSAILAVGAALEQPVVRDGQIVVGHEMSATLSLDHRVIDGAMAAAYLATLRDLLENPAGLLV